MKSQYMMILMAGALTLSASALAASGGGNGGGAWVCRERDGASTVRWIKQVDLFETVDVWKLKVRTSKAPARSQLADALDRIDRANPEFGRMLAPFMKDVQARWPESADAGNSGELEVIDDALYIRRPSRESCSGGILEYGQVVNFSDEYGIQVDSRLEQKLTRTEKAALRLHEAVYAMLRHYEWDPKSPVRPNSKKARKIVSHVFSTQDPSTYAQILTVEPFEPEHSGFAYDVVKLNWTYIPATGPQSGYCGWKFDRKRPGGMYKGGILDAYATGYPGLPCEEQGKRLEFHCNGVSCRAIHASEKTVIVFQSDGNSLTMKVCSDGDNYCTVSNYVAQ